MKNKKYRTKLDNKTDWERRERLGHSDKKEQGRRKEKKENNRNLGNLIIRNMHRHEKKLEERRETRTQQRTRARKEKEKEKQTTETQGTRKMGHWTQKQIAKDARN